MTKNELIDKLDKTEHLMGMPISNSAFMFKNYAISLAEQLDEPREFEVLYQLFAEQECCGNCKENIAEKEHKFCGYCGSKIKRKEEL